MIDSTYDCLVMGGGPAGSTVAGIVAQAGYKTLLIERERFPRFHIGESLMPETYWVFERLGVLDKMKESDYVKKLSIQFVSHTGRHSQPFFFPQYDPRECSRTWQVERGRFDKMLFDNAAEKGADCFDQTRALEVLFDKQNGDSGRAIGARLQTADGEIRDVAAKVVVDATGQSGLLSNALGVRRVNPDLKKAAVWTYYKGAYRPPGEHGGATIVVYTKTKDAWFWYIPQSNDVVSVGAVGDYDYMLKGRGTPEEIFEQEVENCPTIAEWVGCGERVDRYRVAKEFSYLTDRSSGDGWILVGDAWGFIDPIYSSGVYFALKSGEMAADCIVEGLATGDTSAAQLGKWCETFNKSTRWVRKLAQAFYTKRFSFGQFMQAFPHHGANVTDILIGRIFHDDAGKIFDDMDPWIATEANDLPT